MDTTFTTPPTGGAFTFLLTLNEALAKAGWRVTVVTQPGPHSAGVDRLRGVDCEVRTDLWRSTHLPEVRAHALSAWINSRKPDVYVVSISPDTGWLALPHLDRSIATLSIAHNDVRPFYDPVAHYRRFIDCAVGVSEETHRQLTQRTGLPHRRTRCIPYGVRSVDESVLERRSTVGPVPDRPLRLGYVGRLVQEQKRILDLIPLACELRQRALPFELHLIGDGAERTRLEAEVCRKQLGDVIRFWGWLKPDEVAGRLLELDVFLLMSEMEGLPVALLEAMAHGLVPIVSRIPSGNTQLVQDGDNGFLVPVGDIAACCDRLQLLAKERSTLATMRYLAWRSVRSYSIEHMAESYQECFRTITAPSFDRSHRPLPGPFPLLPCCVSRYPVWLRKLKQHLMVCTHA